MLESFCSMISFSYNLSPLLKETLEKIEITRSKILLTPIPPKIEQRMRWEATINRVYYSLLLADTSLNKNQVVKLLTIPNKKRLTAAEHDVLRYKDVLDYITLNWMVSPKTVTPKTVILLHNMACSGRFKGEEEKLKQVLDYIQASPEHPVIQAAIIFIQLLVLAPFTDGNGRIARLMSHLFLYKNGYDLKGFVVLEEYIRKDFPIFRQRVEYVNKQENLTLWLEYFTDFFLSQAQKVVSTLASSTATWRIDIPSSFWELNDRQKAILTLLQQPDESITNKKVQKLYRVSQITASRDLSRLVALGLLFAHGKGRSVHYTKV